MVEPSSRGAPLHFRIEPDGGTLSIEPEIAVVAGFTGRDREGVLAHMRELEAHGVPLPSEVPSFYPVPPQLVSQTTLLVTTEEGTSGEAEVALIVDGDEFFVGVVSDHTDREGERYDIALAKRACHKVIGSTVWRYADVVDHWDQLHLRSWIDTPELLYQDGRLDSLLRPADLVDQIPWENRPRRFVLFCGTLPTFGGIRESTNFRLSLEDPLTNRSLDLGYRVDVRNLLAATLSAAGTASDALSS